MAVELDKKVKIVQGSDRKIVVRLQDALDDAWDLTNVDEITAYFKLADNSILEKTLTGGGIEILNNKPANGKIVIKLTDADTLLMKVSDPAKDSFSSFEVKIVEDDDDQIVQFEKDLYIVKRLT